MAEKQNRSMPDAKLIRISEQAHYFTKVGAAIGDLTLEEWASEVLVDAGMKTRFGRGAGLSPALDTWPEEDAAYGELTLHFQSFSFLVAFAEHLLEATHKGAGEVILSVLKDAGCRFDTDHDKAAFRAITKDG